MENRATQRESMMNVHSESQQASFINGSNNSFTNSERIRSPQDNDMQASDASERSTTAGQSFISSENNSEGQSEQIVRYGSNLNSGNGLSLSDISAITAPSRAPYQNIRSPLNSVNKSGGSSLSLLFSPAQQAVSAQWMMKSRQLFFSVSDVDNVCSEED